ncbi:MAG: tetratricopeptide (TPR) repeat protein/two-component sensor histidine kinase [Dokdonia sp.]|jgi:tetratricopeptide (TPR) repeat protein/two-component sensor histidine kinase
MNCKALLSLFFFALLFCTATYAQQENDSTRYFYDKIVKPTNDQDLLDGYLFFNNQRDEGVKQKDPSQTLYALEMMSQAQMGLGIYYNAESTIIEALKLLDTLEETSIHDQSENRKILYNYLGIIYQEFGKNTEAIDSYTAALSLAQNARDSSYFYNNLGLVYKEEGKLNTSKDYFQNAYSLIEKSTDSMAIAITLDNLGAAEASLDDPNGLLKMQIALSLRKSIKDERRLSTSYKHLSTFYKDKGNKRLAVIYADSAYIAADNYSVEYSQDALFHRFLLKEDLILTRYLKRSDSTKKSKMRNENKFASVKYNIELEKEKKERALLQGAEDKAKKRTYQFIVILVILLSIFLFYILSKRSRKKRAAQVYLTETRISKKVHDEVSNDVYRVMTQIQSKQGFYPEILDNLDDIYKRTRDISRENGLIDVDTDFNALLQDLFLSYQSDTLNLITKNSEAIQWHAISKPKKLTIYRVLQELITNTGKHGKASLIFIEFYQKRKNIHIAYTDNGVGGAISDKNGLQNVENRISAHKGTITFDSKLNSGFKAQIHI